LRLARFFDTSRESWLNLQVRHDLEVAGAGIGAELEGIEPWNGVEGG